MMPKPLTELERRVLDYLIEYLRSNTYQPSIREIGRQFSIKSTKTVSEVLQALADKGWIERDPSRSRGVRLRGVDMAASTVAVPLLGDGDGGPVDDYALDRRLAGGAGVFMLTLRGNHLREQGVWDGDLLVIEPVAPAAIEDGDLVMVRHAHDVQVRRCTRNGSELVVEPMAGDGAALVLTGRQLTAVQGRVIGVVRRLRPYTAHAPAAPLAATG